MPRMSIIRNPDSQASRNAAFGQSISNAAGMVAQGMYKSREDQRRVEEAQALQEHRDRMWGFQEERLELDRLKSKLGVLQEIARDVTIGDDQRNIANQGILDLTTDVTSKQESLSVGEMVARMMDQRRGMGMKLAPDKIAEWSPVLYKEALRLWPKMKYTQAEWTAEVAANSSKTMVGDSRNDVINNDAVNKVKDKRRLGLNQSTKLPDRGVLDKKIGRDTATTALTFGATLGNLSDASSRSLGRANPLAPPSDISPTQMELVDVVRQSGLDASDPRVQSARDAFHSGDESKIKDALEQFGQPQQGKIKSMLPKGVNRRIM